jgi:arylsulfatase A-like enzyme
MPQQPDILLLVLDTLRADRVLGEPSVTPRLRDFANDACFFRQAIAPAQWSIPAHTSLFTGVYPSVHGAYEANASVPAALPTLAERLHHDGYYTAAFCNNPLVGILNNGLQRGFDRFYNYSGFLTGRPNRMGHKSGPLDRVRQWFKQYMAGLINRIHDAFANSDVLFELSLTPLMAPLWQTALNFKGNTPRSLEHATRLLLRRTGTRPGQPVFCFINLMDDHMPYHPSRANMAKYAPQVLANKALQRYLRRFNSDPFGWLTPLAGGVDDDSRVALRGMYDAEVAGQDERVGRFIDQLRASGALDHTLLFICADHGDHLGEKQLMGHSMSLYNELIHVPFIVRDPSGAIPRAASVDSFVSTRRIFHTALSAAGIATPEEQALSLAHTGPGSAEDDLAFSEAIVPQILLQLMRKRNPGLIRERACDQTRLAVCHAGHKLIHTGAEHYELYDVHADPQEQTDLAATETECAQALEQLLRGFVTTNVPIDSASTESDGDDLNPVVLRRLHDLGYID